MNRPAFQEGVVCHLLQASGGANAFFVAGGDIAGGRTAFGFGFRAFDDDDFAWHKIFVLEWLFRSGMMLLLKDCMLVLKRPC